MGQTVMNALTSGATGKTSSKRLAGFIMLGVGILSRVAVVVLSYAFPDISQTAAPLAMQATDPLFYMGAGLLGIGVFEGLGAKIGKKE
jgi:hypothetical protein